MDKKGMLFERMKEFEFEQVVYFYDDTTDLKGIIVIHDTTLGPALGGARIWNYENEEEALIDCMRLARGMTYKSSAAGLNLGGGKAVIIGDASKVKSEAFFRAFGRYVQSLNGRYITAEDVNTTTEDMGYIAMETDYVVGLEGKSGNPSPITALGTFYSLKGCLEHKFDTDDVSKFSYAVQGVGETGSNLVRYLSEEGATDIRVSDINKWNLDKITSKFPHVKVVDPDKIYSENVDVFVPCALGGVLNDKTIPKLKAKIVCGTSNNVLLDEDRHADMLMKRNILYAPDFVINAGGVINVYHEMRGYNRDNVIADIKLIKNRLLEIFKIAEEQKINNQKAAKVFAENRIKALKEIRSNFIKR
ncbi:MAG: Glu/Leu/Phe/Val family dehydrogenase [Acholeplasmataceae bacterium]|jgi:leucine dehydrogenase